MIKIISPGKKERTTTCSACGCVFSFEPEDVVINTVWDDHGGHYPVADFYKIKCPTCSDSLSVKDDFEEYEKSQMTHINN